MILITQLVYVIAGEESAFHQFEDIAIPLIRKYNGKLLLRIRPDDKAYIEHHIEKPYEIHLVEFESEQDLRAFNRDPERRRFLHLKEQSVKASILIQGTKL